MLSSPYPVPPDPALTLFGAGRWAATIAAGVWVLVHPPQSYAGLDAGLTILWGVLLVIGPFLGLVAYLARRYRLEMAALWPTLAGIALYAALSWESALTDSPGAGPRACLILTLLLVMAERLRVLQIIDRRVQALDRIGVG